MAYKVNFLAANIFRYGVIVPAALAVFLGLFLALMYDSGFIAGVVGFISPASEREGVYGEHLHPRLIAIPVAGAFMLFLSCAVALCDLWVKPGTTTFWQTAKNELFQRLDETK